MNKFLAIFFLISLPFSGQAVESGGDYLEKVVGAKIKECKAHFDINPYFLIAIGSDKIDVDQQTSRSINNYWNTGKMTLTASQQRNPKAVQCAIFAEGMMAGSTSTRVAVAMGKYAGKATGELLDKAIESLDEESEEGVETSR